uniref:Uncharacterized protein n=1 Tax=viral metagenome TaxID=1070528 RepID=A0A6C0JKL5_9ZZZZ
MLKIHFYSFYIYHILLYQFFIIILGVLNEKRCKKCGDLFSIFSSDSGLVLHERKIKKL